MFIVHIKAEDKPNIEFRMHKSGIHYYDTRKKTIAFIKTVSGNKEGYTQRQIKSAEVARTLYAKLCYPSWKYFKWVIRSNHIKDCPVTVEDVDVALNILGKNIAALKVKTTWSEPNTVARDSGKIPVDLLELHKEVFLMLGICFVKRIPLCLTISRKICFTAVNHLANPTVPQIFAAFKEIYQYYLHRGFCIMTVHSGGEFAPLQALIASLPNGPMNNLASANEHVPDIKRKIRVAKERC